jgi:hypothetical protein
MTSLQDRRVWIGGGVLLALLILVAGWFLAINPELSSADSLHSQADTAQTGNLAAQAKLNALKAKSQQSGELVQQLTAAVDALPPETALPSLTRQLSAQAHAAGVTVSSITIGASGAAGAPAGAPAANSTAGGGLVSTSVTLAVDGTLAHQLAFLHAVQVDGPRRALVTSTQVTPSTGGTSGSIDGPTTVTIAMNVFSQPQNAQQRAELAKLLTGKLSK